MKNKYNEPRAGCSILIGCGAVFMIIMIILMIVMMAALSGYMPELIARSNNPEEVSSYLESIMDVIYSDINELGLDNLFIPINAAQIVVILLVFKLIYKRPVSQMGLSWDKWHKWLSLGFLIGIVTISLYALVVAIFGFAAFTEIHLHKLFSTDIILSFIFFISFGFAEEILYRGFLMTALKTTRNKALIVTLPTIIFVFMSTPNNVSPLVIVNTALLGLSLAYMFIKTGSLWMSVGFHISWNFVQGNIFGIEIRGLELSALMEYTSIGSDFITGGTFGAVGGLICTFIMLSILAYVHYFVKTNDPQAWTLDSDLPFN